MLARDAQVAPTHQIAGVAVVPLVEDPHSRRKAPRDRDTGDALELLARQLGEQWHARKQLDGFAWAHWSSPTGRIIPRRRPDRICTNTWCGSDRPARATGWAFRSVGRAAPRGGRPSVACGRFRARSA